MSLMETFITDFEDFEFYISRIADLGVPDSFDKYFLEELGMKKPNTVLYVSLFKELGLIDNEGNPTEDYGRFAQSAEDSRAVISEKIVPGYFEVYQAENVIHKFSGEKVREVFLKILKDKKSESYIRLIADTFKTLNDFAHQGQPANIASNTQTSESVQNQAVSDQEAAPTTETDTESLSETLSEEQSAEAANDAVSETETEQSADFETGALPEIISEEQPAEATSDAVSETETEQPADFETEALTEPVSEEQPAEAEPEEVFGIENETEAEDTDFENNTETEETVSDEESAETDNESVNDAGEEKHRFYESSGNKRVILKLAKSGGDDADDDDNGATEQSASGSTGEKAASYETEDSDRNAESDAFDDVTESKRITGFSNEPNEADKTGQKKTSENQEEFLSKALIKKADLLQKMNRPEEAVNAFDQIIEYCNKSGQSADLALLSDTYFRKAEMLEKFEKFERALDAYDDFIKLTDDSPTGDDALKSSHQTTYKSKALTRKADLLQKLNRNEEAVAAFNQIIDYCKKTDPEGNVEVLAQTYFLKAEILEKLQQFDDALTAYNEFIQLVSKTSDSDDHIKSVINY